MLVDRARRLWGRAGWARRKETRLDYIADTAFSRFRQWGGLAPPGFDVNWLGQLTDCRFVADWADEERSKEHRYDPAPYPALTEETFEWLALLDAVSQARGRFVMVEAGAGYGRWLVGAALALRQAHPGMPCTMIGIEGDAQHYRYLQQHFRDNGLDPSVHHLIHGAVSDRDGSAQFSMHDDPNASWGQYLVEHKPAGAPERLSAVVATYSVETLLSDFDRVDHMDFDISGTEQVAIAAGISIMTNKVRRVFVETHGLEIHEAVAESFLSHGWKCVHCHGFKDGFVSDDDTPFGRVSFQGGVQSWINPRLAT